MKRQYKLAIGAAATAQDALELLDLRVQELYEAGYTELRRARIYQAPCGGLHVAYKELVRDVVEEPQDTYWFVRTKAQA